jgi:hypothetical protein
VLAVLQARLVETLRSQLSLRLVVGAVNVLLLPLKSAVPAVVVGRQEDSRLAPQVKASAAVQGTAPTLRVVVVVQVRLGQLSHLT